MTAEEKVKRWKAEDIYSKKLICFAAEIRDGFTLEEIANLEGWTMEELNELLEYDKNFRSAIDRTTKIMKKQFIECAFDRAFGYWKADSVTEREQYDSSGKAVKVRYSKKKWHDGSDDAFFYWAKKYVSPDLDKDKESRDFKKENNVCPIPKKKKK